MATRKVPPQPGGALGEPAATPAPPPPGVPAPPADPSVHRSFGPVERRILGALHARDLPALERLLLYPDLNVHQRNLGRAALLLAVRAGWAHVVRQLMRLGVDPNRPLRPQDCRNTGLTDLLEDAERGILPLLAAAQTGRADIIAALVDEGGADVNARTADGWTALEAAAYAKHDAAVRALVDRGATSVGAGPATGTDGGGIGWGDADEADGDYEEDGMAPVPSVPSSAIPTPAGSISAIFDTPPPATPDPTVPPRAASHLAADANIDVPRVDSLNPAISPRSASLPSDPTPPSSATLPFAAGSLAPSLAESSIPLKPGAPGIVVVPPTLEREFPDEEGRYPPGSAHGALVEARRALQEEEERARGESSAAATGNAEASRAELAAARAAARMASSESLPAAAPSPVEVAPPQQDDAVARAELAAARAAARMAGSEDYLPASPSPAEVPAPAQDAEVSRAELAAARAAARMAGSESVPPAVPTPVEVPAPVQDEAVSRAELAAARAAARMASSEGVPPAAPIPMEVPAPTQDEAVSRAELAAARAAARMASSESLPPPQPVEVPAPAQDVEAVARAELAAARAAARMASSESLPPPEPSPAEVPAPVQDDAQNEAVSRAELAAARAAARMASSESLPPPQPSPADVPAPVPDEAVSRAELAAVRAAARMASSESLPPPEPSRAEVLAPAQDDVISRAELAAARAAARMAGTGAPTPSTEAPTPVPAAVSTAPQDDTISRAELAAARAAARMAGAGAAAPTPPSTDPISAELRAQQVQDAEVSRAELAAARAAARMASSESMPPPVVEVPQPRQAVPQPDEQVSRAELAAARAAARLAGAGGTPPSPSAAEVPPPAPAPVDAEVSRAELAAARAAARLAGSGGAVPPSIPADPSQITAADLAAARAAARMEASLPLPPLPQESPAPGPDPAVETILSAASTGATPGKSDTLRRNETMAAAGIDPAQEREAARLLAAMERLRGKGMEDGRPESGMGVRLSALALDPRATAPGRLGSGNLDSPPTPVPPALQAAAGQALPAMPIAQAAADLVPLPDDGARIALPKKVVKKPGGAAPTPPAPEPSQAFAAGPAALPPLAQVQNTAPPQQPFSPVTPAQSLPTPTLFSQPPPVVPPFGGPLLRPGVKPPPAVVVPLAGDEDEDGQDDGSSRSESGSGSGSGSVSNSDTGMSESTTEDLGVSSAASPSTDSGLMESEYEDGDAEHGNGDGADEGSEDEAEPEQPVWIRSGRAQDRSELSKAVRSGSIQEVKALIAAGGTDWAAALNSRDNEDGLSPLLHAGMAGDSAMIRVLLELCLALPRHPVFSTLVTVVADALAQLADRRPPDVAGEEVRLRRLKAELAAEIGRTREGKNDTPQEKKRIRQRMIDHRSAYIREVEGFTDSLADFVALRHRFANEMAAGLGVIDTELASLDFGARNTPIDEGLGRAVREFQERAEEIERQFAAVRDETLALLGPTLKDADRDAVRELVERTRETLMGLAWEKVRGFQERQSRQGTEVVAGAERLRRTVELVCDWSTEDLDRWESVLVDWETVLKEAADEQQEYLERLVVELEDRVQTLRGQLKEDKGRMEAARNAGNAALVEQLRRQLSEMHADWQQAATTLDEYRKLMGDVEKVRSEIGANDSASQVAARRDEDLAREYGGALRDPMEDDDMVHVKDDFADRVATHLKMIGMKGSSSLPSAKGMQGGLPNGFPGTYQPLAPPGRMNGSGQEDDGDYRRQARVIDQNLFADF